MRNTSRRQFLRGTSVSLGGVVAQSLTPGPSQAAALDQYARKYKTLRMRREDGILEMQFHTDGGPLRWGGLPHSEFERVPRCRARP